MLKQAEPTLWSSIGNKQEWKKFAFLSAIFFCIICTYWVLRPIKDSLFFAVVGREYLWAAKIVSLIALSPVIALYGRMVDKYAHYTIFYGLATVYALCAFGFMYFFMHSTIGLANTVKGADRLIGWAWYVYVESFGALMVALFWAIAADVTTPTSAQRGFPVIVLCGQLGNIIGPTFLTAKYLGFDTSSPIIGICAVLMLCTGGLFGFFIRCTTAEERRGYEALSNGNGGQKQERKASFFEGLRILFTETYMLGIFTIVMLYETVITVFDYHFKQSVGAFFLSEPEVSAYLAAYAQYVGIISTLCVLFGINSIQYYLGIRVSLILLPLILFGALGFLYLYPASMGVAFWVMVFSKSINYALNQPTMKQLYIPTSPAVKYKAQAWLDVFGSRGSKAFASLLNGFREITGVPLFMTLFSVLSLGFIGIWICIALFVAKVYERAIAERKVVC